MMSIVLLLVIVVRAAAFAKDSISSSEEVNVISDLTLSIPKSWNVLIDNKIIVFDSNLTSVKLLRCYCLTSDTSALQPQLNIGHCFYGCFYHTLDDEYHLSSWSVSDETSKCSLFNREGILCGQCKEGYGSPVYSFSLKCVPCSNVLWTTIPLYILVAYGPLTVFLVVIVVFTVSVNSAPLHGWILVCQIMSSSMVMRTLISTDEIHKNSHLSPYVQIFGSVFGMWNLDFFRSVYKPFCLHHSLTTLQVLSLDYIIAAYPLVMILAMYVMVDLYSRNCRPVVIVGRLFHHCCIRFRHRLNVRTSLIDAFGTFFSLSYIKFLSTTVDLLMSTQVWSTSSNTRSIRLYFDGTKELFKGDHIPYAVVGVSVTLFCNILPIILLLLYSFPKTHAILNILPLSVRTLMFPFMDNILGCYKDGTNGTRNCCFFTVVYHFALFGYLLCFLCVHNAFILGLNCYVSIIVGMLVAVIQPYKSKVYNTVDIILILSVGLCFAGAISSFFAYIEAPYQQNTGIIMAIFPAIVPFIYFFGYVGYKFLCIIRDILYRNRRQVVFLRMMTNSEENAYLFQ